MAKRRGNPNWGKPEPIGPIVPTITEFEQVVKEYKLSPDQYLRSTNKNSKYIPEPLLEAWGFEIESTL
jgi:predicted metal-binding protein